jgi:aspartyl-tRNA(Asn)/glutamyl-tRNA(Gln) amidotransferase subunit A
VVADVEFPDMPYGPVVGTIVQAEGASAFRDLIESGRSKELRAVRDRWGGYAASMVLAVDYLQAMRIRVPMKRTLDELYAKYDALVAPSRGTVSYPIGVDFDKAYPGIGGGPAIIPAGNAVGQPAISVLNGFGAHNLPTGIQFTGRAGSEARLIAIAHAYQQATNWHKKRPSITATAQP